MLVHASALVAMLTDETKAQHLAARLQTRTQRLVSPVCATEATAALAQAAGLPPERASDILHRFLEAMTIRITSLPAQTVPLATEALGRFGRSAARPDGLVWADCLAYAVARYYRLPLLADDSRFLTTDLEAG